MEALLMGFCPVVDVGYGSKELNVDVRGEGRILNPMASRPSRVCYAGS
jgi:hypothetical protein